MIRRLNSKSDFESFFPLISQLRKHLDKDSYFASLQKMIAENYELWGFVRDGKLLGFMGMREYTDFVRGTHLYIDDLVVDEAMRSRGIGAKLLEFAEQQARSRKLPSLRLACAIENTGGAKFYEKEKWIRRSHNFVKTV